MFDESHDPVAFGTASRVARTAAQRFSATKKVRAVVEHIGRRRRGGQLSRCFASCQHGNRVRRVGSDVGRSAEEAGEIFQDFRIGTRRSLAALIQEFG